jgi:hypothetical protein
MRAVAFITGAKENVMMIDREARKIAAQALRDFISGKITNFAFEALQPKTEDLAIHAIWDTAWLFYDDFKTHRLEGRNALSVQQRKSCVRWITFLHADLEYCWPPIRLPGSDPNLRVQNGFWRRLLRMDPFGLSSEEATNFLNAGHYAVWPFISVEDYKKAVASPHLLSGRRAA